MADNKKSQYLIQIGEESQLWDSDKLTKNSEKLASSHPEAQVFQLDDYDMSEAPSSDASYIVTIGGESQQWDSTKFGKNKDKLYAKYPDAKVQKVSAWRNPYLKSESEMAKENLDAFRSENGAFLDDFESREATEQAIANKNAMTGVVAQPAEGAITGEERGRYLELHKQEEELKKAYYNSSDVVNARLQRGESINTMQKDIEKTLFQMENDNPEAFKEMRQASIKRSNPRTALIASRPLSADAKEIQADYSNYVAAQNLLKDAVKINNAPSKYDSSNGFVNFMKGMGDTFSDIDFWSAGLTEIAGNMKLRGVLSTVQEKLGNLNNLSEEDVDAVLTDSEKKVLAAFVINTDAQYDRAEDMSRALQAGQGAAESLGFMAEFILTGGVAKGAAELAESAANKVLRGYLGKLAGKFSKTAVGKYAGGLAKDAIGAAARTLVLPSTYRNMSEKAVQIKEDPETGERRLASVGEFAAEGFADSFIEALAEGGRVGAIGGFFDDVLSSVKPAKKLIDMARKSDIADLYRTISNTEALSVLRAGGWHGIGEEYLEEWYGAALRTLTNLDPEALKDFASVDNQLITLTSFLPMTLIGGSVSTGQVLHSKKDLEKKSAVLKSAMIDRGYTEDQANLLVDSLRSAPMQNISDVFTPMVNKMAQQENGNAPELMRAVSDFAMASARMQSYGIAYEEQEARQRRRLLSDMEEQIGRFWQEDAEGNRTVELATTEDGTPVYILGREKYEEVTEDGVITPMNPEYMAVDMQGNVRFVNNVTDSQTMSIDDYLNTRLIERRGAEEEARIAQETEQYQNDIKSQIVLNQTVLNMGTQENPINGLVVGLSADGVTVQTNEGVFSLTWNEVGNKLAMPNPVQTDAQIDEAEAANLDAQQNAREAMLDEQFDNPLAAEEEIAEGEAAEDAVEEVTYNYPLKKDGSVDGNALWNENVREWIRWNNQRIAEKYGVSDNGMDSLNYLQNQISSLEKSAAQISSSKNKETDLDKRMTLEDNEIAVNRRLAELRGILAEMTGETAAPEAVVAEEAQAEDIAESPAVPEQAALPEQEKDRVTMEIESLMDGTLDDSEIEAYISNNLKKAQKALVSHNKKSPKIGTDKEQYLQDKKRHQEKAEQLQHDIDFWEEVKTSMEAMRGATVPEQSELVNKEYDLTPMTPAELVADYFGSILSNAPKIRKESFLKHTGYSEEDAKKLSFFLRKNSGITMEAMADLIVEYDSEHGYNILDHNDPTAGLNALLDAFSQVTSHWDMFNMIKNNRKAQAESDAKSLHDAMIYAIEQATHMSYEEYKTYQKVSAREIYDAALTDDQINELNNIFAEDYYDYEDYRLNNEGETPGNEADVIERTDGIREEGDAVLQGEQSAVSGESTGAEEGSEDSAIGGGDGNAYAPGDAGADSAERAEDVGDIPDDIWFSTEETPASQQPKGESQNGFEFNENGVCTNPITIELPSVKKGWANGNDVRIAEFNGKWGYSINVHYSTGGMGWAVAKRDCVLNTKEEAFTKAYEDLVRYRASHAKESGLKDLDNLIKYLETEYPFVKEAAAPKVEDKYKFEDGVATNPEVLEMPGTAKGEANRIFLAERNGRWGYAAETLMDNDTWGSTPKIQVESLRYDSKEDAINAALNYFRFYKEMKKDAGSKALDAFVKYIEDNYLSDYTPPKKKERKPKAPAKAQQTETAVQGSLFGEEEPSAQAEADRYNAMLEENNLPDVLYLVDAYSTGDEQYIRAISGQMREHMSKMSTAQLQKLIDNFDEFFPVNSQYDDSRRGHALAKAFITDYAKGLIDVVNKATSAVTAKTEGEIAAERENKRRQPLRDRAKSWEEKLGVKVNVIENIDGVTNQQVVEHINNGGKPQGWYESDGSVSIYLPNVKNVSVIDKTVIHEVVAHKGMRQLLGEDKYAELCDNVFAAMSEDKQAEYFKKPGVNGDPRKAADEYIAYLAEDVNYDKSTWEKVVDALMNFLAELGIMKQADIKSLDAFLSNLLVESYNRLSAQAQKQKADAKAETKPAAKKAKASRSKVETKIEDFGEKIGGARKDAARSRIRDAAKLSRTDLNKLNDPDKILSRKQIIKYVSEGQMTVEDGQMLLAANMAVRGESYIQKDVALTKYRDLAVAWEKGEDLTFEINDQDVETIYETYSQKIKDSIPELRDRIRKSFTISLMNNYHGYLTTYKELNYPVENRDLKGTYVRYGLHDSKYWVVSGPNARRGWPKASMAEAVNYIKNNFPVIEASNKDAKKNEDGKETFGHLHVVKSRYGGYRIKSRNIPGDIYISGKDFVTKRLAEAYLKENAEKLMEIEARMSEALMGSNIGMVERQGKDYRNGKDVTPQDFMDTFGFRGVEFGNWVPQAERQMYLNKTYDAIMDFCEVVGISPKAFSLGGRLGLAFGARGKSSALAHYEPMKEVINLTRMKGAGSLAHEWFHALDNFLAKQKSGNTSDMATATRDTVREEVASAFDAFVRKMNSLAYTTRSRMAGEYWGEVWERAARLFENYVYNELGGRGTVSPLLVRKDVLFNEGEGGADVAMINGTESASWWPYPSARENEEMKPYFDALFDAIQEQVQEDGNVVLYRSKPEPDENVAGLETLVERTYRTSGAFSFSGKDQIESRDDVAFIFRQLEDSAVENSFLVFVKNGVPTILHVGMGDISSTFIDKSAVLPAYKDFGADKVYMVHNHPSGSLYASMQDVKELAKIHDQLPGVPVEGIIIDTVSGEYAVFNDLGDISQRAMPNDEAAVEIEVLSFDRNVFAPDYKSKINERRIQGPQDIAAFLSAHRLGQGTKVGALLLNRQNVINGNLVTNDNEVSMDNADELASQIAEAANRTGSSSVILFGDFDYSDRALRSLSKTIKSISAETVNMLDVVRLEGNYTQSLVDETLPSRTTLNDGVRFREMEIDEDVQNEMDAIKASAIVMGNFMKAPNGKTTNLTPEQWMMVRTEGFKFWFGDWENDPENASKVVDENGEPMVVYHGTQSKFTAFDVGYKGKNFGFRLSEGFYFSPDETVAESYASFPDELKTGEVKAVFLKIINPFYIKSAKDYREQIKEIVSLAAGGNRYQADLVAGMSESELLSQRGYDGVVENRTDNITGEIVVFDPNQIKSATDNTGVFSVYDDIRFREREENESVMDFYQSELDAYKAKYNEITPMAIADINSKKSVEDAMGQKISFLLYRRMRHLYSTGRMKAVHFPNGRIAIFADKKITDSKIIELQAFHETIHEIGLEDVGKYMWENPGVNTKRARLKELIRKRYRKADHHSEMAAYVISECMCIGKIPQLLNTLDDARRAKVEDALKTIGYDTEQESRIRLSGTGRQLGTSDVVRNTADEGTAESGEAGRKRPRVTWTKTLDATPTEDVVAEGLKLSDRHMAELAGNLFAAFPAYVRKQITDSMNGNPLKLQEAIFQISTSLAEKDALTDEDIAIADIIAREVQAMIGTPLKRPLRISEALWMLYDRTHPASAYDLVGAAKKAQVKDNLGFSERKLKEKQEFTLYREATQAEIDAMERSMTAADIYNRDVTSALMRLRESFQDMYRSTQKMVDAIVQKTGKAVKSFEDIMLALNQLSSKNLADKGKYLRDFLMPMWDAVLAFKKNGYDIDDVIRYVMLKHGLERNDVLAKRDARYYYKQAYEKKLRDIESNDSLDEAKKQQKKDKAKADYDFHLASIESGSDAKYRELRERDYGAVMALYAEYDEIADRMPGETVEQFNARQKAARHLKYTDLAVAEAEAEREVKTFEDKNGSLCDKLWKRINAATKETLKHQYEHNVISKQTYDNVSGMFSFYVPLRGFKEDTAEDIYSYYGKDVSTDFANPIIKTKGRTTLAESPFGWIGSMAESAIQMDNKNDAKMRLYYFVLNRSDQNLLTLQKTWYKKVGEDEEGRSIWEASYPNITPDMDYNETRQEIERHNAEMKALAASGMATQKKKELSLGNSVVNISDKAKPEHAISVLINGEEQVMYVNGNPRAAQAINGMLNIDNGDSGIYRVLGQKITRWMSQMNTSYNPAFWISNYERDLLFTIMNVNIKEDKAYQNQFWSSYVNPAKVTKLLRKYEKGTLDMNDPLERMYKEFADNGGVTGFTVLANNEEYDKLLEKYARDVERSKFIKGAKAALGAIQDFAEGVEQASRFAAYMTSRKMGRPVEQAIGDAKEVTVNFNRKGSGKAISWEETANLTYDKWIDARPEAKWAARVLTMLVSSMAPVGRSVYMFFNASIQGLRSFATLAKRYPGKTAMWAGAYFGMGFALVALNHMINSMLGGDDDDYLDIPDWERRNNILIGGNGFYLKWALPQEARPFYAMADIIYNKMVGRSPDEDIVEEITRAMFEVLPVNPMGEGGLAQAVVPSALSPIYDVWQNTDYKGMPLYSESYWSSGDAPKYDKAYSGTGKVFVEISRILNNVSGGDYAEGGKINVHPAAIEHIIEGYGGGTVTFFNQVLKTLTGNYFEGEWTVRNTPFLNRVLTINDDRYRNAHTTELFRYYEEVAKNTKRIYNVYKNNDDIDKLDELMEEDRYEIMRIYERYRKQEEKYDDLIRDSVDTDEKKELMAEQDELRREMIKEISEL